MNFCEHDTLLHFPKLKIITKHG